MRKRESHRESGLGWIDVVAILSVVALLAVSLGQIARGRVQQVAEDAAQLANAVSEVADVNREDDAESPSKRAGAEG